MPNSTFLAAIVGLLSALMGGAIQAFSNRNFERLKFEQENKWDLYSKYFLVLGELSFSEGDAERHINALSLMAQLRGRIGVVGSPDVIEAVGEVFKHPNLATAEAQEAMAIALDAMRRDVGSRGRKVSKASLVQLMFGSRDKE